LNFFKNNIGTDEETPLYQSTRGTTERPESRSRTNTLACVVCLERNRNVIFSCNHVVCCSECAESLRSSGTYNCRCVEKQYIVIDVCIYSILQDNLSRFKKKTTSWWQHSLIKEMHLAIHWIFNIIDYLYIVYNVNNTLFCICEEL
jgi:hypothetical protein